MATDSVDLSKEYRALLRRDWAVRVLDAETQDKDHPHTPRRYEGEHWIYVPSSGLASFPSADAARTARAVEVFPKLPPDVRSELGGCP